MTPLRSESSPSVGAEASRCPPGDASGDDAESGIARRLELEARERRTRTLITCQALVLETIAGFHDASSLETALVATSDAVRRRFGAERVVIGLAEGGTLRVSAISQQAAIDPRAPETRLLALAMDEACRDGRQMLRAADIGQTASGDEPAPAGAAHRDLLAGRPHVAVVTTPLCRGGRVVGALLLESVPVEPIPPLRFELLGQIGTALAPMIDERRTAERSLGTHVRERVRETAEALLAPRRLLAKGIGAGLALALLAASLVPIEQRIGAAAELVPLELRAITAPVTGFVGRVAVTVGDRVEAGDLLFELDTRDLVLERDRRAAELAALAAELRAARATGDRKQAGVLRARSERTRAELALAEQRIARSTVVAPDDAVVLAGSLAELVGAPVERGQRLVELAPDGGYTVGLLVDERDVGLVAVGQRGTLVLEARAGERLAFEIDAIHPLAVAGEGRNRFRVDATLLAPPPGLLPGQTGVGKVDVGEAPALHQMTRRFVDWARLSLWERFG